MVGTVNNAVYFLYDNSSFHNKENKMKLTLTKRKIKQLNHTAGLEKAQTPNIAGGYLTAGCDREITELCNTKAFGSCYNCGSLRC